MDTEFTDKQLKFLEVLFNEAEGDLDKAKKLAGYSVLNKVWLTDALQNEVINLATRYLAVNAPKAAMNMVNIMAMPTDEGNDRKLAAAKEVLDRSGLTKLERIQVNSDKPIGIFILPPKDQSPVS